MIPLKKIEKPKMSAAQKTAMSILSVSIIVFFYFAIIILLSKLNYDPTLLGVIREMLTIPGFVILAITLVFSLVSFIRSKFKINSLAFYALLIQLVTIGLIVYIA